MKTYIFAARDAGITHHEIDALSPMLAIRELVRLHGAQPYRIVNIFSL